MDNETLRQELEARLTKFINSQILDYVHLTGENPRVVLLETYTKPFEFADKAHNVDRTIYAVQVYERQPSYLQQLYRYRFDD